MNLPPLTAAQRTAALEKAASARRHRAELKHRLKQSKITVAEFLDIAAADELVARMPVVAMLASMPGVGKISAQQIMQRLGIAESRRVRGLGPAQRQAIIREFS